MLYNRKKKVIGTLCPPELYTHHWGDSPELLSLPAMSGLRIVSDIDPPSGIDTPVLTFLYSFRRKKRTTLRRKSLGVNKLSIGETDGVYDPFFSRR